MATALQFPKEILSPDACREQGGSLDENGEDPLDVSGKVTLPRTGSPRSIEDNNTDLATPSKPPCLSRTAPESSNDNSLISKGQRHLPTASTSSSTNTTSSIEQLRDDETQRAAPVTVV
ncbi:hypothetical protein COLO4_22225 [Corchorus olitorius]|uniref:Uncharacterized protein n=1 Tax=Corchorus olitorius TaxID=93759 RepID=A0A1R3INI9_9ROSI|nr:hypothetical protein COLO4_22225 [Corchorus olitorius]